MNPLLKEFINTYRRNGQFNTITIARDVAEAAIQEFRSGDWHHWALRGTTEKVKEAAASAMTLENKKPVWTEYEV